MAQLVMLNNVTHRDLRVITRPGAEFGDNVGTAMILPTEIALAQRDFPVFFRKDEQSGEYMAVVLLGLQKGENLFLEEKPGATPTWTAEYVPAVITRGPFFIGFQPQQRDGKVETVAVINVDLDHPRISRTEGEPLFQPDGSNSPYLNRISDLLNGIHQGFQSAKPMFEAFAAADLFEPVQLDVKVNDEEKYLVTGLMTINREKLANLDADTLFRLHRAGYLQWAFLAASSLGNVQRLIDIKNARRAQTAMVS